LCHIVHLLSVSIHLPAFDRSPLILTIRKLATLALNVFLYNDHYSHDRGFFWGESAMIELLGLEVIHGHRSNALDRADQIVISESLARNYFRDTDPIGQRLYLNSETSYEVSAVFRDVPVNSHFPVDAFISFEVMREALPHVFANGHFMSQFYNYLKLYNDADPEVVGMMIQDVVEEVYEQELRERGFHMQIELQPVEDVHLHSDFHHEIATNGSHTAVSMLSIIAWFILIIAMAFIIGTLTALVYTSTILKGDNLSHVMKGITYSAKGKGGLRKIMLTVQFCLALGLILSSMLIFKQYHHIMNQEKGFRTDDVLVLKVPVLSDSLSMISYQALRSELSSRAPVEQLAFSTVVPGSPVDHNIGGLRLEGKEDHDTKNFRLLYAESDYFDLYDIPLVAGEMFSGIFSIDSAKVLLNETAVRNFGLTSPEEAIGKRIFRGPSTFHIIGVVGDMHQVSPKEAMEPLTFMAPTHYSGYLSQLLLASLIIFPVSYLWLDRWLNQFAMRIAIPWTAFLIPLVLIIMTTLLTVWLQSLQILRINPAVALKE